MRVALATDPPAVLRRLTAADADAFAAHIASDLARLSVFLPWPARTADPRGAAAWLSQYDAGAGGRVLVAGVESGDDLVAGVVLFGHDEVTGAIELGCWALSQVEGRGIVRAACVEALRVARGRGVERVVWHTDPRNVRSRALAERLGFRFEGTLRSSYVLRGERLDTDLFSLVGPEIDLMLRKQ